MLKGRHIPLCADAAKELYALREQMIKVRDRLREAGLPGKANDLWDALEHVRSQAYALEQASRDAFAAARRGEELPK